MPWSNQNRMEISAPTVCLKSPVLSIPQRYDEPLHVPRSQTAGGLPHSHFFPPLCWTLEKPVVLTSRPSEAPNAASHSLAHFFRPFVFVPNPRIFRDKRARRLLKPRLMESRNGPRDT